MPAKTAKKTSDNLKPRPPIVVILGHVDHGKTSILDHIRKSKVVEKESGGITQHIGAYQVAHQGKIITFIDTPGHEAFSAMRSRGAKVADIAVLVVAAEEGVKPQTKEAIGHILRLNLPLIVAINKMDKPNALPDKVKKELADNNVLVESLGGQVPSVFTSTKTGLGINELLEMILLIAEMENFQSNPSQPAAGVIIESKLDPRRGVTATLLIKDGSLTNKDVVAAESTYGQIKTMEDFLGKNLTEAGPATPVLITGFGEVPPVGEEWQVMASTEAAKARVDVKAQQEKHKRESAGILDIGENQKVFNLILKADVFGSLEAIREVIKSIPQEEIILRVVKAEVGDISEGDLKLAESAKAKIYGFRVKSVAGLAELAERRGVKISQSDVIYELVQTVRQDASRLLAPEVTRQKLGQLKIAAIFKVSGQQQIVGGRVTNGKLERGALADIVRNNEFIGSGKIVQLQQNKKDVAEVGKDRDCGLMFEGAELIDKGDIIEAYKEEKKRREL